jgi:hypothetical protein
MFTNINRAARTMALALLVCGMMVPALAQDQPSDDAVNGPAIGRYAVLPLRLNPDFATAPPAPPLQQWNGSFVYLGTTYPFVMVGTAPAGGLTTTVKTFIIPVKVIITKGATHTIFDPAHVLSNGNSVTKNTRLSPIFDKTTKYVQGGVNVGTTQYVDAYQRGNLWGTVQTHTGYHVYLGGPTVLAEQTLAPPPAKGVTGHPFGPLAAEVDINWFDAKLQAILASFPQITPNTFVIFDTYNVYLYDTSGCCIGGYHTAIGVAAGIQTYSEFTYVDTPGVFSQDVSALSHEVGEWMDDPLTNGGNNSPCGILENGDPLEGGQPGHPYGDWAYTLNGFTYHLQDLVMLPYFGAPHSRSVNGWLSFQNAALSICSNGS